MVCLKEASEITGINKRPKLGGKMKTLLYLLPAVAILAFTACTPTEKKADVPPPPQATPDASATAKPMTPAPGLQEAPSSKEIVEKYEHTLVTSMDKARAVKDKVELEAIGTAIRDYQVDNGKYPASLDDIKDRVSTGFDASKYTYHPETGTVAPKR
jgi:hypothetical protein